MAETYGVVKASLDTNINANGANANSGGGANTSITKVLDLTNALPYDDTRTYEADSSLIIRLGKLYICNTTIGVPEPFNASKWDVLTSASNSGEQALTDSVEATIIFAVAFSNTDYSFTGSCYDAGGNSVDWQRTEKTATQVKVIAAGDCTIEYTATQF